MKDHSPAPEVPADGMDASTPRADWSFEEVERVVRMLCAHAPFKVKDKERWKALVREAFDFLDNLDEACEEILEKRMERREMVAEASARAFAARHLPFTVPFEQAMRFITGEKRKKRALERSKKFYVTMRAAYRMRGRGVTPRAAYRVRGLRQHCRSCLLQRSDN